MTTRLRPIGDPVVIFGEKKIRGSRTRHPVDGTVVGYAQIAISSVANVVPQQFVFAYIVRLTEGCDTPHGIYMREIPVFPDDLTSKEAG